jgi:aryl-alcohol dehydrogenase-like predicted oxidoreductase
LLESGMTLEKIDLGRTHTRVTRFALGGFHQIEISSEVVERVVEAYIACGGNYIETARGYGGGSSEVKLGRALAGRRERVVLCTKTGAATADEARRDLETSLEALRTDHVEFCLFHCVAPGRIDALAAPGGAAEGLRKARDEGLIDAIGMSSHHPGVFLDAFDRLPIELILIWCNYLDNLNFPAIPERVIPEARRRGIGVTAMKPLADGFLHRSVEAAIRCCLHAGADVAVCGANSIEQVRQAAAAAAKGPGDDALHEQILRDAPELGRYVCRRCGRCPAELMDLFRLEGVFDRQMIDFLPHGPAEAALRKVLSGWFGKKDEARDEHAAAGHDAEALVAAAEGVECPYGIDVARKARLATAKLTGGRPELI